MLQKVDLHPSDLSCFKLTSYWLDITKLEGDQLSVEDWICFVRDAFKARTMKYPKML